MIAHNNLSSPVSIESAVDQPFLQHIERFVRFLPHASFAKDLDGNCVFTNTAFRELDGGQSIAQALLGDTNTCSAERSVRDTGQPVADIEITHCAQNGSTHIFKLDCIPLQDEDGALQGTVSMLRDHTEAYEQARQLTESTNLMQSVLEHLPVRVFWKDEELTYMGCNTVFANDMGFAEPSQLIGHDDFHTGMTHEEAELCRGEDFHVIETQDARYGVEEVIGTGEDKMWIRVSKVPLRSATGERLGILGMYEDIEEQKKAQIELENALRRERDLNELKTRFISTVSHEFRNPLAVIQSSAELLLFLDNKATAEQRAKRLNAILGETERMEQLMESVLFIGREDIQDVSRQYEAVNLVAACEEIVKTLHGQERVQLSSEGDQQPVICLPLHLSQIVQNLLSNALKYSDTQVDCRLNWGADSVTIEIKDQGIGIPAEDGANIFDSFFRSNNVGVVTGNGLGLYIVKRAVDLHNGSIEVDSVVDAGTVVSVELPLKPSALEAHSAE